MLVAGVDAALHNHDEAQLVGGGEDLVLYGWVLAADGTESRDCLAGPEVEQEQLVVGVQLLVVG